VQKRSKLKVVSSAERSRTERQFVLPNPGDLIVMLVFGWGLFCLFLVTVGERLLRNVARLASSDSVRVALLEGDQALGGVMIGGSLVLVVTIVLVYKFPRLFLPGMAFALVFASASWKPLHDIAWLFKYLGIVFLGAYAVQSMYKNFWRFMAVPFLRLIIAYLVWVAVICFFVGGRNDDYWYLGTEVSLLLGFAVVWVYEFNNKYGLEDFNRLLSWAAVAIVVAHLTAPILVDTYLQAGRFQSYFVRATGFGMGMAPVAVVLFWRAMSERDAQKAGFFSAMPLLSFGLILWSGSRSPTAATIMGVAILWWLFRSRLLLVMLLLAVLGVAVQLVLSVGSTGDLEMLAGRLQSTESGRTLIWAEYILVALQSPIYGYSPSGMKFALIGGAFGNFLAEQNVSIKVLGVHNSYLGIALRFGFVGLALFMAMLVSAARRAKSVLASKLIPEAEKRNYILPAALIAVLSFVCMFEDKVPGAGKGTTEGFFLYASIFICQVYGARLINIYERAGAKLKPIATVAGMKIMTKPPVPAASS